MLDFYLIVDDYRSTYDARWLATANRLIPPNVFPFAFEGMSAKYAVLSEADFARLCGAKLLYVSSGAAEDPDDEYGQAKLRTEALAPKGFSLLASRAISVTP